MIHFPRFAQVRRAPLRYFLILIHLPVIALAFLVHATGGIVTCTHGFVIGLLNNISQSAQTLFNHVIVGVEAVLHNVVIVARGPELPVKIDPPTTVPFEPTVEQALPAEINVAASYTRPTTAAAMQLS